MDKQIQNIINKAKKIKDEKVYPTRKLVNNIMDIVYQFIVDKGRIIYGGYCINFFLKKHGQPIYEKDVIPDYDIYSPDPIQDCIDIANILKDKGYNHVVAREARHNKTYTVFAETIPVLDLSYMQYNIYKNIPIEFNKDKVKFAKPEFLLVDIYRQYCDPLITYTEDNRLQKAITRGKLLEKYYPIKKTEYVFKTQESNRKIIDTIFNKFVKNNDDIIVVGTYAYNYYVDDKSPQNCFDIYSTKYLQHAETIKQLLKNFSDITVEQYTPFFQFLGYKISFKYKNKCVVNIFDNLCTCIPYNKIDDVNIATYHVITLYYLYLLSYARVFKQNVDKYYFVINKLKQAEQKYMQKNQYDIYHEKNKFKYFSVQCIGQAYTASELKTKNIHKNKLKGKPPMWTYYASTGKRREKKQSSFMFANDSGYIIKQDKYKKF